MMEMFETVMKNFLNALSGKKPVPVQESDEHELCENEDNQRKPVPIPSGE